MNSLVVVFVAMLAVCAAAPSGPWGAPLLAHPHAVAIAPAWPQPLAWAPKAWASNAWGQPIALAHSPLITKTIVAAPTAIAGHGIWGPKLIAPQVIASPTVISGHKIIAAHSW